MQKSRKKKSLSLQAAIFRTDTFSRIYMVILLCVFPLFLASERYVHLTRTKAIFFFVTTGLYLLSIPLLHLTQYEGAGQKAAKRRILFTPAEWALLAYMFFCLISAIASPYPKYVFWGLSERYDGLAAALFYGGCVLFISRYYRPREMDFVLFAISAMLVSVIGILQYFDMDPFHLFPYDLMPGCTPKNISFRTTLGNIDFLSAYTALAVLFFSMLYIKGASRRRFVFLAASALSAVLMMLAGADAGMVGVLAALVFSIPFWTTDSVSVSRMALLGGCCALSIFAFRLADKLSDSAFAPDMLKSTWLLLALCLFAASAAARWILPLIRLRPSRKALRIAGVTLMLLTILAGFAFVEVAGRDTGMRTVYEAREVLHGRMEDSFGSHRGYIWLRSLQLLREETPAGQFLFGSGPDTFVDRFRQFHIESTNLLGVRFDKAHNEYLQILFCQGILGLAAYLAFLGLAAYRAVPRAFDDPLTLAALIGAVAYAVQAFFSISAPIATPLFFALLGLTALRGAPGEHGG